MDLEGYSSYGGRPSYRGGGTLDWETRGGRSFAWNGYRTAPYHFQDAPEIARYSDTKTAIKYQGSNSLPKNMDMDEEAELEELSSPARVLAQFAERTSMMGVLYIHTTQSRPGRLIWTLLLLGAMTGLVAHLYMLFHNYYSFETFAKVQISYDNLQFPAVTVCNINPILSSKTNMTSDSLQRLIQSFSASQLIKNADKKEDAPPKPGGGFQDGLGSTWSQDQQSTAFLPPPDGSVLPTLSSTQESETTPNQPFSRQRRALGNFANYTFSGVVVRNGSQGQPPSRWEAEATQTTASLAQDEFQILYSQEPRDVREAIAHQKNVFIQECSFAGRSCYPENFTFYWNPQYGACYTLQYSNFVSLDSGPYEGLELLLFLQTDEYLRGLTNGNGLQVLVHEQDRFPFPSKEGFAVSAGTETFVPIKLSQISRMDDPYGECNSGAVFESEYKKKYTRQLCQEACLVRRIVDVCQCYEGRMEEVALLMDIMNSTIQCRTQTDLTCASNVTSEFKRDKSLCDCVDPCEERKYTKTAVSSRQWPSQEYAEVLARSMCVKDFTSFCDESNVTDSFGFGQNFVKLNIYFEDLNYETISETPSYELAQFASDVGGTLGLWIGLSVLSVFEIWQLLLELCMVCTLHRHAAAERNNKQKAAHQ